MKKKIILLLIVVLSLTGCSINYDLVIKDDETIKEKMTIPVSNKEALEKFNTVDEYIDYYANIYKNNVGYAGYNIKTKKGKETSIFTVNSSYKSLDEYIKSFSFLSMFNTATIERLGKYITFTTSENEYLKKLASNEYLDEEYYYEDFKINIKFYNEVVDSNADEINKEDNIYTWDIVSSNPKEYIMFKMSDKKRYDVIIKDFIMENIISLIAITTLIVGAVIVTLYIKIKRIKNDRI